MSSNRSGIARLPRVLHAAQSGTDVCLSFSNSLRILSAFLVRGIGRGFLLFVLRQTQRLHDTCAGTACYVRGGKLSIISRKLSTWISAIRPETADLLSRSRVVPLARALGSTMSYKQVTPRKSTLSCQVLNDREVYALNTAIRSISDLERRRANTGRSSRNTTIRSLCAGAGCVSRGW